MEFKLLLNRLGIWNLMVFMLLSANCLILLYVVKSVYQYVGNIALVILVGVCAAGITGSLFILLLKLSPVRGKDRLPGDKSSTLRSDRKY